MTEHVYIVEVRATGATDWRPVNPPYLTKGQAERRAVRCQWIDRVESRVCVYALLPEGTTYSSPASVSESPVTEEGVSNG